MCHLGKRNKLSAMRTSTKKKECQRTLDFLDDSLAFASYIKAIINVQSIKQRNRTLGLSHLSPHPKSDGKLAMDGIFIDGQHVSHYVQ
jgi:hypothetical protein